MADGKTLCSWCHKTQPYREVTVQINYGFNDKEHILIDGVERLCEVCGKPVDHPETTQINHDIVVAELERSKNVKTDQ